MAGVAPATGTCPSCIVIMPMTNVCASAPKIRSVVAERPTIGLRSAKCHAYATIAAAYRSKGAAFTSVRRRRREVSQLGPRRHVRPVDAYHHPAPRAVALRVARRVTNRVLTRQFVRDLAVDVVQIRELVREERPSPRFLRELPEDEFRFLESACRRRRAFAGAEADRVNRRLRSLRQIEYLFEGQQARRVFAVGQDDDRLP